MFSRIHIEDIDLVKIFIGKCKERLGGLEKEILRLEIRSEDTELLNHIFSKIHCIKIGSSYLRLMGITTKP